MGFEAWVTLGVVIVVFVALVRSTAPPDLLFLGATAFLALVGIITPEDAFAGFSNPGMLTVGLLFVIAAGLRETGVLDYVGHQVLGRARSKRAVLGRLAAVVLPLSAFLNNTPVVAMFIPVVIDWSRRNRISPSKLLIPLSYFAILGGTLTLIGTSTNLVVHGLMIDNGLPGIGLFEIGYIGLPSAVIGLLYLFIAEGRLLPERKELLEQLGDSRREYLTEMLVQPGCRLIGNTVESAGFQNLPGLFLIEIDREGEIIGPVQTLNKIEEGDRLIFTGVVGSIIELKKIPGLIPAADPAYELSPDPHHQRRLCEAVISESSKLVGNSIREADFRAVYGAAVVAVHRGGQRIKDKLGDVTLRAGDTLLLQVRPTFARAYRDDPDFYLVSDVQEWRPLRRNRAWISVVLFAILIVLMTTNWVSTVVAAALIAMLMILSGCISSGDAQESVEWPVLITIAASFGVGVALQNSGAATAIASKLVASTEIWGPIAALAVIYFLGSIVTELITNNAAAVLLFPFCLEVARLYEVSPRPFMMALAMAASASFMTPIGYQTNMMVYGVGGYRFTDFFRVGGLLNLLLWMTAIILIPLIWPF